MRSYLKGILALVLLGAPLLTLHAQLVSEHLIKAFLRMDILTEQSQLVIASSLRDSTLLLPLDLGEGIQLTRANESCLTIETSEGGRRDLRLLQRKDGSYIVGLIEIIRGEGLTTDSRLSFYSTDGEKLSYPSISTPSRAEFLSGLDIPKTSAGYRFLELLTPLPLALSWHNEGTNLYAELLPPLRDEDETDKALESLLQRLPRFVSHWNGSTFTPFTLTKE